MTAAPCLRRRAWRLLALVPLAALMACAPDVGDLGRPRPSVWNSAILPTAGDYVAWARGEQVSSFHFTDAEIELRDRAWRFVMPAHEKSWFQREVQELARTRIIPVSWQSTAPDRYAAALTSGSFRSEVSRYRRLGEDALADAALIRPFVTNARQVLAADRARLKAVTSSPAIEPPTPEHAHARVAENEGMIAWVRERTRYRIVNYRHALDNLVVELPSAEAVMAERAILALEAEAKALDGLAGKDYRLGPPLVPPVLKD
jgi:hypothetical protein